MYQQATSTTTNLPYSNGNLSTSSTKSVANGAVTPESESDLSEAIDDPNAPTTLSNSEQNDDREKGQLRVSDDESLQDEDAVGSDDPDYDMATPPTGNAGSVRDDHSSTQDSPRQRKRKAGPDYEEDYMLNDPELYGLRRSVSHWPPHHFMRLNNIPRAALVHHGRLYVPTALTYLFNRHAYEHWQVDDDSENDDSGSDIRSGPPRKRRRHLSSAHGKF